ncbi:uncharacterized protein [Venturia canescens]|uniref:uncharacterized protein n=1 Tax=Venturia canescens TaxID=32260 RepID=UPI001C9CFB17|nr:uncharacterized protein LOC122415523 [Venturia canescens]XP_043283630.1 uncharacterized protein LOC122415523 [Venturia canescens]
MNYWKPEQLAKFSTNECVDSIEIGDQTVMICGYVSKIDPVRSQFLGLEFVITNGRGKFIHCMAVEIQAEDLYRFMKLNSPITIDGASCVKIEDPKNSLGNVGNYQLIIDTYTRVSLSLGTWNDEIANAKKIDWSEIRSNVGNFVTICGTVRTKFRSYKKYTREKIIQYGLGSIANGSEKIDVRIKNCSLPSEITGLVSVSGTVMLSEELFYIEAPNDIQIKKLCGSGMTRAQLMNAYKAVKKMRG